MNFNILIRMETNRAEYIECPIAPVVEQTLHGTHGWRWGNKPHDSSCGVRFGATLAANTAPEQKRHPISFVLELTPRGTH